jgi:hypothetical protein
MRPAWFFDSIFTLRRQLAEIQETKVAAHGLRNGLRNSLEHGNGIPEIQEVTVNDYADADVEKAIGSSTVIGSSPDPFSFKNGVKSEKELDALKKLRRRKVYKYYGKQNELIEDLLRPMDEHVENAKQQAKDNHLLVSQLQE